MSSSSSFLPGTLEPPPSSPNIFGDTAAPPTLQRASSRLRFPPAYVVVGVYRLFADEQLYKPVWDKCRHGVRRGLTVAAIWAATTFHLQRKFIELFMMRSPSVTGLSHSSVFGIPIPFGLSTYATVLILSTQLSLILTFFLSRNLRIARDRAWDQTLRSRGKGPDFWRPYVEEWVTPPVAKRRGLGLAGLMGSLPGRWAVKLILSPLHLVPVFGIMISAYLKALGTARYLHLPYYKAKGMSEQQIATFMEERKWDYRIFGFAAALLESLPFVGLIFTVSNRVGACMWAHDLEKKQHYVAGLKISVAEGKL